MITDLPDDFIKVIKSKERRPIQLCHLHRGGRIHFLSDSNVGIKDGLLHDYAPIVENWGTIRDNSYLNTSFSGESLEIKSNQLTLILTAEYKNLLVDSITTSLDNTIVELYQWFKDTPNGAPQLVDVMVVQDPINYSESSALLELDLVSIIMRNNPYLWPVVPGEVPRDIVVGKMTKLPLINLQTARVTAISQDITFDYVGQVFIDNGIGFRAGPDLMVIDSEIVQYDWISASAINLTVRGAEGTTARPHIRGAVMCHGDSVFDYAICAGPVAVVDNLLGNGIPYTQPVTLFPGQNPVIARFIGRPPWLKLVPGAEGPPIIPDEEFIAEFGLSTEAYYGDGAGPPSSPGAINTPSGSASMAITSLVGGGPGTVSLGPADFAENDLGLNDTTKVSGTAHSGDIYTSSGLFGDIADGAIGSCDSIFDRDGSAYGNLVKTVINVHFSTCKAKETHYKFRVVLVKRDGSTSILQEWEEELLDVDSIAYYTPFSGKTYSYEVNIGSFEELRETRVRYEIENITSLTSADGGPYNDRLTVKYYPTTFWTMDYFIPAGAVADPWQQLSSYFNRDLSYLGTLVTMACAVRFNLSISNANVYQAILFNGEVLWSRYVSVSQAAEEFIVYPPIYSWADLINAKIGVYQKILGPYTEGLTRQCVTTFDYVSWYLTYQPGDIATPDEERLVYADELSCDVTSILGADPTPATIIQHLIEEHSSNGIYVDRASFSKRNIEYQADNYFFNGVFNGGIRLHEAIRQCLMEGMARLLFSQGSIGLLNYSTYESLDVDYRVESDEYFLKSKKQMNQPTSSIVNDSTVMYDYNPITGVFDSKVNDIDDLSIAKFERHEKRGEYTLIRDQVIAEKISKHRLDRLSRPITVLLFDMFMPGYILQKGDRVIFDTMTKGFRAVGHIVSVHREVGQGKNNKMNKFVVSVVDAVSTTKVISLFESVVLDSLFKVSGAITRLNLYEPLLVGERMEKFIHLGIIDEVTVDDSSLETKVLRSLFLSDAVVLDQFFETSRDIRFFLTDAVVIDAAHMTKGVNLGLLDTLALDDSEAETSTAIRLRLADDVLIDIERSMKRNIHIHLSDSMNITDEDAVVEAKQGYGAGLYGENRGYGN